MERIKVLLEHIIASAHIRRLDDIEICARTLLGSIERECTDELALKCEEFAEEKVVKMMMEQN